MDYWTGAHAADQKSLPGFSDNRPSKWWTVYELPSFDTTAHGPQLSGEMLATLHPAALEQTLLKDLTREYTLDEIAILTRAAPAKILGLQDRGSLSPATSPTSFSMNSATIGRPRSQTPVPFGNEVHVCYKEIDG